jgi:hypothetical protein
MVFCMAGCEATPAASDTQTAEAIAAEPDSAQADSGGGDAGEVPPTTKEALKAWLTEGTYLSWAHETATHTSQIHFGLVLTYLNSTLFGSLQAGSAAHPAGAAAVKELYGDGASVLGWSVSVKLEADSAAGQGWYWYEIYKNATYASAQGAPSCTVCHALGKDFVRSAFPLH